MLDQDRTRPTFADLQTVAAGEGSGIFVGGANERNYQVFHGVEELRSSNWVLIYLVCWNRPWRAPLPDSAVVSASHPWAVQLVHACWNFKITLWEGLLSLKTADAN